MYSFTLFFKHFVDIAIYVDCVFAQSVSEATERKRRSEFAFCLLNLLILRSIPERLRKKSTKQKQSAGRDESYITYQNLLKCLLADKVSVSCVNPGKNNVYT